MRCAMEMVANAITRKIEIEKTEILKHKIYLAKLRENTIAWCENIGVKMENMVRQGKIPTYSFTMYGNYVMSANTKEYADHRVSWNQEIELDLEIITEWFGKYCFKVCKEEKGIWIYGCGYNKGFNVTIKPDPSCI